MIVMEIAAPLRSLQRRMNMFFAPIGRGRFFSAEVADITEYLLTTGLLCAIVAAVMVQGYCESGPLI